MHCVYTRQICFAADYSTLIGRRTEMFVHRRKQHLVFTWHVGVGGDAWGSAARKHPSVYYSSCLRVFAGRTVHTRVSQNKIKRLLLEKDGSRGYTSQRITRTNSARCNSVITSLLYGCKSTGRAPAIEPPTEKLCTSVPTARLPMPPKLAHLVISQVCLVIR